MTRHRRAFTLVELLVVVAIIAIILSLLLPALRNAREAGKSAVCLSNLHQAAMAGTAYVMEYKGYFPPFQQITGASPGINILHTLASPPPLYSPLSSPDSYAKYFLITQWGRSGPYEGVARGGDGFFGPYLNSDKALDPTAINPVTGLIGTLRVLGCPSLPVKSEPAYMTWYGTVYVNWPDRGSSYGVNVGKENLADGLFDVDEWVSSAQGIPGRRAEDLPARMVTLADGTGEIPYLHFPFWPHDQVTARTPAPRHVNTFNAGFVGGHAKGGTIDKLWLEEFFIYED